MQGGVGQDFYIVTEWFSHATAMLYHDQQARLGDFSVENRLTTICSPGERTLTQVLNKGQGRSGSRGKRKTETTQGFACRPPALPCASAKVR